MDLFDIRLTLRVSISFSVRDKSTISNVYIFRILKAVEAQFDYTKSFVLSRKSGGMQSLQSSSAI